MTAPPPAATIDQAFTQCRDMEASLNERLACYAQAVHHFSPVFGEAVDRLVERLRDAGAGEAAPGPGEPMPPFMLPDEDGHMVAMPDLLQKGPLAVTFHRGHWCPYCRININALVNARDAIAAKGGQIVAIMPERQQFAAEFKSEAQAPFPILTDIDNGYALSLNLAIWLGPEMEELMSERGRDLPKYQGNESWMLPIPATFVVGTDGIIKARFVDPDYRKRMEIDDLLAAFSA